MACARPLRSPLRSVSHRIYLAYAITLRIASQGSGCPSGFKLRKSISLCDTGLSLHNKDAMTVSVNKLPGDQSATQCPECGGASVVSVTVTSMCVYLRCRDCSHTWSIPERRAGTRETDVSKVL